MNSASKEEILQELNEVFEEVFDDTSIVLTPSTSADDIPEWDSFYHIQLIVAVEVRFGMKFQTSELENLKNVGEMVTLIQSRMQAQASRSRDAN